MNSFDSNMRPVMTSLAALMLAVLCGNTRAQEATTLEPGKPITRTAKAREVHTYLLTLTAGQFIRVVVEQNEVDVSVELVAPDNKSAHLVNLTRTFGQESLSWEAATSGTYKIIIRTLFANRSEGSYQVQLDVKGAATAQDKQRVAAERWLAETLPVGPKAVPWEQRLEKCQQALRIWRELGDQYWTAVTLDHTGSAYFAGKKYDQASESSKQALAIKHEILDHLGKIVTLNTLGVSARIQRNTTQNTADSASRLLQQDREYHEQALALSREIKHRAAERHTLNSLTAHYRGQRLYEKVIECMEQMLTIDRENKNRTDEATTLHQIGYVSYQWSRYEKALGYYDVALAIFLELKDRTGEATSYREISNTYDQMGRYEKSIEYTEKSLAIWRERKNQVQEGSAFNNLGIAYGRLNRYEKAIEYLEQALAIYRQAKIRQFEGGTLVNLGQVHLRLGHYEKALEYLEQALVINREFRNRAAEGNTLSNFGVAFHKLGRHEQAIEYHEQALAIVRADRNRPGEIYALTELANSWRALGQVDKAIGYDLQALQIAREIKSRDDESFALNGLLQDWKARNQPQLAILFGKQAVNISQELRSNFSGLDQVSQQSFLKSKEQIYRDLADLLIAQGRLPEAEQVIRMLKEEEYFEYVRRDVDNALKGEKAALTPEEAAIEKRYREIGDKLSEIGAERGALLEKQIRTTEDEQRLAKLEADLTVAGQMFQKFLDGLATEMAKQKDGGAQITTLRDAQGLMEDLRELGKGVVALYTLVGENKYRVILTTADFQRAYEYPIKAANLNRKILAFRTALQNPKLDPLPLAQELYQILVAPVAKDLRGAKAQMLMWSLDGVLRYVPVVALHDGEKYLVERFRTAVFTPASNARLKDVPSRNWKALGLGVTKSFGPNIPALPGVAEEMRGIINEGAHGKGVLPGTIKLDEQFTQEAMLTGLRQRNPVVHVATHFQFKPGNETDSALLLGDGQFLSLAQIKALPNVFGGVELLTLSACNTATSGTGANGKEVEGFGVLAQNQGAKAVVASLWPVADRSTKNLMQEFYRLREAKGNVTKVEAMRQAHIKLLRGELQVTGEALAARDIVHETDKTTNLPPYKVDPKAPYAHPYYWAPFILIGNWK